MAHSPEAVVKQYGHIYRLVASISAQELMLVAPTALGVHNSGSCFVRDHRGTRPGWRVRTLACYVTKFTRKKPKAEHTITAV
jgi:hypothetical protein